MRQVQAARIRAYTPPSFDKFWPGQPIAAAVPPYTDALSPDIHVKTVWRERTTGEPELQRLTRTVLVVFTPSFLRNQNSGSMTSFTGECHASPWFPVTSSTSSEFHVGEIRSDAVSGSIR